MNSSDLNITDTKFWGLVEVQHEKQKMMHGINPDNFHENFKDKILDIIEKTGVTAKELKQAYDSDASYFDKESSNKNITTYVSGSHMFAIMGVFNAALLKKEYDQKYPDHDIDFNQDVTISDTTFNPTRQWLTINGQNLKDFEESTDGS